MGTRSGLLPSATGTPENQIGAVVDGRIECDFGTSIGMTVTGVSLFGKCEMRGVPGGGRMRENSDARDVRGVCLMGRATSRLALPERSATRD
jgi:hypothetical protein